MTPTPESIAREKYLSSLTPGSPIQFTNGFTGPRFFLARHGAFILYTPSVTIASTVYTISEEQMAVPAPPPPPKAIPGRIYLGPKNILAHFYCVGRENGKLARTHALCNPAADFDFDPSLFEEVQL